MSVCIHVVYVCACVCMCVRFHTLIYFHFCQQLTTCVSTDRAPTIAIPVTLFVGIPTCWRAHLPPSCPFRKWREEALGVTLGNARTANAERPTGKCTMTCVRELRKDRPITQVGGYWTSSIWRYLISCKVRKISYIKSLHSYACMGFIIIN